MAPPPTTTTDPEKNPPLPPRPARQTPEFAPPPTRPVDDSEDDDDNDLSSFADTFANVRERLHQLSLKVGAPINKLTNKLGSEAFWPASMELECDKAARILTSFCHDGFYTSADQDLANNNKSATAGPEGDPAPALVTIPPAAIRQAAGLAIFTTFRTGLNISGAGGSGVVVARLPDGGWSPPSGFVVHTLGAGLLVGFDIYDCVCVLRTRAAVDAFTQPRVSLGGEIGLVAGPVGAGGSVEAAVPVTELAKSAKSAKSASAAATAAAAATTPVWSYMKSRGLYAGVQADGTVVLARPDANADFYGKKGITVAQILAGRVPLPQGDKPWTRGTHNLMEALKEAEGRTDVDSAALAAVNAGWTPGDLAMDDEREKETNEAAATARAGAHKA